MGGWILFIAPMLAAGAGRQRLLMLRGRAGAAWSQLDARLGRRRERIQALLGAVGEMSGSESEAASLAGALRRARDARGIPARAEAENELSGALRRLRDCLAEERRSDHQRIRSLAEELRAMEEQAVLACRSYNMQVMAWNQSLHRLPWSLIARLCRYQPIEYFVLDEADSRPERPISV